MNMKFLPFIYWLGFFLCLVYLILLIVCYEDKLNFLLVFAFIQFFYCFYTLFKFYRKK